MKSVRTWLAFLCAAGALCLLTGCASVMCGSKQAVSIDSRPRGADVLVYNSQCEVVFQKTTPCVATLPRRHGDAKSGNYVILIKKEGYEPAQIPLAGRVNTAYYLNILCGGVGFLVDPITGAMWTLQPQTADREVVKDNADFFDNDGLFVTMKASASAKAVAGSKPAAPTSAGSQLSAK
jgi:hypothetical protein